jgi:hypothetical protein
MEVFYAAKANLLTDATTPELLTPNSRILEYYCTGDLLEQAEEYVKAGRWWADYYKELEIFRNFSKYRLFPDKIRQLREVSVGA